MTHSDRIIITTFTIVRHCHNEGIGNYYPINADIWAKGLQH